MGKGGWVGWGGGEVVAGCWAAARRTFSDSEKRVKADWEHRERAGTLTCCRLAKMRLPIKVGLLSLRL